MDGHSQRKGGSNLAVRKDGSVVAPSPPTEQALAKELFPEEGDPKADVVQQVLQEEQNAVLVFEEALEGRQQGVGPVGRGSPADGGQREQLVVNPLDSNDSSSTAGSDPLPEEALSSASFGGNGIPSSGGAGNLEGYIKISLSNPEGERAQLPSEPSPAQPSLTSVCPSVGLECSADGEEVSGRTPLQSYTGPNSDMQLIPRDSAPADMGMKDYEILALGRMKDFCAQILKALAPPLLREVQAASALRPEAEPFTPRRSTRGNFAMAPPVAPVAKQSRKATAAETVLLKALGITPADLNVDEAALQEFKLLFDSPIRDQHIKVLAPVFGKTMPSVQELARQGAVEISVCA